MANLGWDPDLIEMGKKLIEAREMGSLRLFAVALDKETPARWFHCQNEGEMRRILDSREDSRDPNFRWSAAVVVVNPQDSTEVIMRTLSEKRSRIGRVFGYFEEFFSWQAGQ